MKISSFMSPDDLYIRLKANSKKQVLQEMVRFAASRVERLDERAVLDLLMERERLGCTGIGNGIAIPHTRCTLPEGQTAPLAVLATLDQPIDFEASDDAPVDIVFLLLAPEGGGGEHLTVLALASRLLGSAELAERLRTSTTTADAWSVLINAEYSVAAA